MIDVEDFEKRECERVTYEKEESYRPGGIEIKEGNGRGKGLRKTMQEIEEEVLSEE